MSHRRWFPLVPFAVIVGLLSVACVGLPIATPTQSPQPSPTAILPSSASPHNLPTTTQAAPSAGLRPGWAWYRNAVYSLQIPGQWRSQAATRAIYGEMSRRFISPETETEVDVTVLGPINGTDWQGWLRAPESHRVYPELLDYPVKMVSANATFHGHAAFFFYNPGAVQWGDIVALYFQEGQWIYQIMYRSQTPGAPLPAENAIFSHMLASFTIGKQDGPSVFPVDWADGATLSTYQSTGQDLALSAPLLDISGTVLDYGPGTPGYVIQSGTGQTVSAAYESPHLFQGWSIDWPDPSSTTNINQGDPIRVVATRNPAGTVVVQMLYRQDAAQGWQLFTYRSFFDLDHQPPPPGLLKRYPLDGSASLWLYGASLDKILPYLVKQPGGISSYPADRPVLVHGSLRSVDPPQIDLDALYTQDGSCETIPFEELQRDGSPITRLAQQCYNWHQLYPAPDTTTTLSGQVLSAVQSDGVIVLRTPVSGFVTLALSADVAVDWSKVVPGAVVSATGLPGDSGALIVSQIAVAGPS